ncbi:MAG: DMT family transporter [Muribaculaceae bacterium]|nr:DMT family transporter [Muribaculaceae bacterium]MDE7096172.1 DMT family transporter [Muribaculaceae bacterium]
MKNIGDLNLKGHMAMLGANVCWGLMSPVAKLVFASGIIAPIIMVDFRIAGAALLFWITSLFTAHEHVPAIDKLRLFGAGMIGILLNQGCFIIGVSYTSPGEASLVTTTMPMWVMLLAWLILHEPITLKKAGGIALGAAGALILVLGGKGAIRGGENPALGDFIVLMAQLSYALYLTFYRNFIKKYSLVTLMKWMFLSASIVGLPSTISFIKDTDWSAITISEWIGVGYVVFFATYLAYIFIMIGQKNLRPTIVGMYNYVQPIVATLVGISLGLDHFNIPKAIAVVLIFSGVYLVTISKAAPHAQTTSDE